MKNTDEPFYPFGNPYPTYPFNSYFQYPDPHPLNFYDYNYMVPFAPYPPPLFQPALTPETIDQEKRVKEEVDV